MFSFEIFSKCLSCGVALNDKEVLKGQCTYCQQQRPINSNHNKVVIPAVDLQNITTNTHEPPVVEENNKKRK